MSRTLRRFRRSCSSAKSSRIIGSVEVGFRHVERGDIIFYHHDEGISIVSGSVFFVDLFLKFPCQPQNDSEGGCCAAKDPEAHDDGGFGPAEFFEVVVDGGNEEDFAAEEFF